MPITTDEFRDALAVTIVDALQDIALGVLIVGGVATLIAALMIGVGFATPRPEPDDFYGGQYVDVPYQDRRY